MERKIKKVIFLLTIIGFFYLIVDLQGQMKVAAAKGNFSFFQYTRQTVLFVIFGVLMEWPSLKLLVKKKLKVNLILIPTAIILMFLFIPHFYWLLWFGYNNILILPINLFEARTVLGVVAGILLVRSLVNREENYNQI